MPSNFSFVMWLCHSSTTVVIFLTAVVSLAAPVSDPTISLDKDTFYRLDLFTETLRPIPQDELKKGAIYFRFSKQSGHHVWSRVNQEGVFEFALGPGSVQPAWRFDIREGQEDQLRLLEQRAPELYRRLATEGARPMIKLDDQGRWDIDVASNEGRVFDMETGQRWEWHGGRRVAVTHTGGRTWAYHNDDYVPVPMISRIIW